MKKTLLILGIIALVFAGCKKFDEIEASKVEIIEETIESGWDYIKINVEYDYPVELESVTLYLSEKEDLSGAEAYECNLKGKKFSVEVEGLKEGVGYYYCYEYDNGYKKEKSDKSNLNTISKIEVVTKDVTNIKATTVTLNGSVINSDAANKITEKGFCWDTKQSPTIEGNHYNNGGMSGTGTSDFSYNLTSLLDNKTYYVRTYAKTNYGTIYGEEKSFTTVEIVKPTVKTNTVTNIAIYSATCGGNVTDDGNGIVTARGICWSEVQNPTINNIYSEETNNGTGTGSFTSQLTNLKENTTYYVRAYATNEKGTSYGEQRSFTTIDPHGYEYVDLGLPSGLKWATCNVGASSPEDYGDYFAWGETETKTEYTQDNSLTYGLSISQLQSQGYIDGNGNLTPSHDAATANWGGSWRMPTEDEIKELKDECTWTWTTQNGVNGRKVTGPNGNHIFLPAAGRRYGSSLNYAGEDGYYWSSSPYESNSISAYRLRFNSGYLYMDWNYRYYGHSVRPVSE